MGADADHGSESNYCYLEDELSQHAALIPYGAMFKEHSKKWQTDDLKVMNWNYDFKENSYIDSKGVRCHFNVYCQRTDMEGFVRDFKEYQTEKMDANQKLILKALTPKRDLVKSDVEIVFGFIKPIWISFDTLSDCFISF